MQYLLGHPALHGWSRPAPVPGYCSNMNDYHTQYLTHRGNNILALTLVNIDIGDGEQIGDQHESLSEQETDLEEEINKSIAGAAGNENVRVDQIWKFFLKMFSIKKRNEENLEVF